MENPILDDMPFNSHLTPEEMQDWENLTADGPEPCQPVV
jgi:hypothetical protein